MVWSLWHRLRNKLAFLLAAKTRTGFNTAKLLESGWDAYARDWRGMRKGKSIPALRPYQHDSVQYLGDEWTVMKASSAYYGIDFASTDDLLDHLDKRVLSCYLPSRELVTLEIGPGGGRLTQLLLQYSRQVICADISRNMLAHLPVS